MPERKSENACSELQEHELFVLTEFFKMLGAPARIHLLFLLMERDACVSDLANRLGLTQSAVSHQLSLLKANKLVRQCIMTTKRWIKNTFCCGNKSYRSYKPNRAKERTVKPPSFPLLCSIKNLSQSPKYAVHG